MPGKAEEPWSAETAGRSRLAVSLLQWLRDSLGDQFLAGGLVHTGPRAFGIDDGILALPVWSLRA